MVYNTSNRFLTDFGVIRLDFDIISTWIFRAFQTKKISQTQHLHWV